MNYSSNKNRPLILVTNDDGIHSPGLYAAAQAAAKTGDVLIAAPHTQQTGMGRSFPRCPDDGIIEEVEVPERMLEGLRREKMQDGETGTYAETRYGTIRAYAVHGSPARAVAHGVLELADRKPDLCVSGINYGENLGTCLTCSGTLGALFEASSHGIPGIAVSVEADLSRQHSEDFGEMDWSAAQSILERYIRQVLEKGMPGNSNPGERSAMRADAWNINVPDGLQFPYPERRTVLSRQNYFYFVRPEKRDYSQPYRLKSEKNVDMESLEKDSDIYAVYVDRVASVTPLKFDMSVRTM